MTVRRFAKGNSMRGSRYGVTAMERPLWLALLAALVALPAGAETVLDGSEFQVNSFTTNEQSYSAAAMDAGANFVITWMSEQDGSGFGVFGQRFNSDGTPRGPEFQVNSYTTTDQSYPKVASEANGDFVVVWQSYNSQDGNAFGIFGQRYASNGTSLGSEFQVNTYTTSDQTVALVGMDLNGDFVVVWTSSGQDGDGRGVFGQRYASNGSELGGEFAINTYTTGSQYAISVASAHDGDFVVAWQSAGQDGDGYGVFGQRFASDGTPQGDEFQINSYTAGNQLVPSVAVDGGDFVVVWQSYGQDGSGYGVFGQRFNDMGVALGDEFQVNSDTSSSQAYAAVAMTDAGDFLVSWNGTDDGSSGGVFAQLFDAGGSPEGGEFQVNAYTTGIQAFASASAADDGHFVIAWQSLAQDNSDYGIFARRLAPTGACCTDISCSDETEVDCDASGGLYGGDETTCTDPLSCQKAKYGDFSGDGTADLFVYRPSNAQFYWRTSESAFNFIDNEPLGSEVAGDIALFGDMDGDGIEDPVVWRSSTGRWYWKESSSDYALVIGPRWGLCSAGDTPLLGDMDGDGRCDPVVWRTGTGSAQGIFYWVESSADYSTALFKATRWGSVAFGDRPFLWDMDGDGKADPTVWRQCDGFFHWKLSSASFTASDGHQLGEEGDVPMLADMNGDDQGDVVVWRVPEDQWVWTTSSTGFTDFHTKTFGDDMKGDIPVAIDLDGDMDGDLAVWRRSARQWRWTTSSAAFTDLHTKLLGAASDEIPDHREREANTGSTPEDWAPTCGTAPSCAD